MIEALFYDKIENGYVKCRLCGHNCVIPPDKKGVCRVRKNIGGKLYSLNSDKIVASALDPIEKKPLYHFLPGSFSFSVASAGCNFNCPFCQNYSISHIEEVFGEKIDFKDIVRNAVYEKAESISYTYSEPTVFYELVKNVSLMAKKRGIKNVIVSNGFMSDEVAEEMSSFIDGANIDLKFFSNDSYKRYTSGNLDKVKSSIEILHKKGVWVELTTLIIPGLNDSDEELDEMSKWIVSLDADIPWHISRFFPQYKMLDKDITPLATLKKAYEIGKSNGIRHIYIGNVRSVEEYESTYCWKCGKLLIKRNGFYVLKNDIEEGLCPECGAEIKGLWK